MLDDSDDETLALDAANGDGAAFSRLLSRHYDRIHALAWRFTGGPPDSEDLAQDVCVTLARRIRGFRGEARFTTWLYKVVLNASRDRYRSLNRRDAALTNFVEVDALRRAGDDARAEEAVWLRAAIADLKPDLRETAVLILDEGITHGQAAEILEVKESTISWRLMKIREAIAAKAEREGMEA